MAAARTRQHLPLLWALVAASQADCTPFRDELFTIDAPEGGSIAPSRVSADAGPEAGGSAKPAPQAGTGGTTPVAGAGTGGAGAAAPASELNPSVSFDWPTTVPGAGLCRPNMFNGSYSCKIETIFLTETLEGSILLVLKGSSESQQLAVAGGTLLAFDQDTTSVLTANVASGTLDCSQQLLMATAGPAQTEILTIDRQVGWLVGKAQPQVTATLVGNLDRNGQTIKGDVKLAFEAPSETTCVGTFTLRGAAL